MTRPGLTIAERWEMKVKRTDTCWLWTGALSTTGYSRINRGKADGGPGMISGHRWAYEHFIGPIPDGLEIDHLCNVRACVNPTHLEPVTALENVRRAADRRRAERERPRTALEIQEEVVSSVRLWSSVA